MYIRHHMSLADLDWGYRYGMLCISLGNRGGADTAMVNMLGA